MGADDVLIAGRKLTADVSDIIGEITLDYALAQVAELSLGMFDSGDVFDRSDLARFGTTLTAQGSTWQVGAADFGLRASGADWTIRARSQVARTLRRSHKGAVKGVLSTTFVARQVKAAGGTLLAQRSQRKAQVSAGQESTLGVIDALASDLGWSWCEYDGLLLFMDPHHAWTEDVGLPQWKVTWGDDPSTDAIAVEGRITDDDPDRFGSATMEMPLSSGRRLRPMHTVRMAGIKPALNGSWLVTSVSYPVNTPTATVAVELERPRKGRPQKRTGKGASDGELSDLDGEWIVNSTRVIPPCTRSPRQYVAYAQSHLGPSWYGNGNCLAWVSVAVSEAQGRGGLYAKYVWKNAPANAVKSPKDTNPPIGAIVVWDSPTGGSAGHIGISIGGGKMISATGGAVRVDTIAGFGSGGSASYLGAMTPHFYT